MHVTDSFTSKITEKTFDVNKRIVKYFKSNGLGYSAMESFYMVMNMEGMSSSSFTKHADNISMATKQAGQINLVRARQRLRDVHHKYYVGKSTPSLESEVLDIAVSFDGSWHKRGHTSNHGVGCVIELYTGLVIDYYCVLSKYCQHCAITKNELGERPPEFAIWYEGHKQMCDDKLFWILTSS